MLKTHFHTTAPVSALLAALILAGCATQPDAPQVKINVPAAYKEAEVLPAGSTQWKPAAPAEGQDRGAWWLTFADPKLNELLAQAQAANPNLAAAAARLKQARAALRGSQADRLPQIGANLGVTRDKPSPIDRGQTADIDIAPSTSWRAGVTASYEVDLFSRVANGLNAANADAQASAALYQSVLLTLQGDVAQAYFELRTLDAETELLSRTVGLREENLDLIEKRYAAGDISELDVARARTELASTRAEAAGLRGARARAEHALALLLGMAPAGFHFAPTPLAADAAVPAVPAGLPSALLERRPDVAAAQARMMAANARVGQARSAIFPALALTANGGYASYELSDLFNWSARSWLTSAVLSLPVFDGGRNRANITRAQAQLEEVVEQYRGAVLGAFGDVEDKLSSLSAVRDQTLALDQGVVAARRAAELADKRYRAGADSYLTLIDAQRGLLAVERQAVRLRGAWATSTIGLIRALGGGWGGLPAQAQAQAQAQAPAEEAASRPQLALKD